MLCPRRGAHVDTGGHRDREKDGLSPPFSLDTGPPTIPPRAPPRPCGYHPAAPWATCLQRRKRHLSLQAVHRDLACPQHLEKSLDQVCLCVPGLRSPSAATAQAEDPSPLLAQLLSYDSVFLVVHLSPGSPSHGSFVFCGRVIASVVRLGEWGGQSRPARRG